ncbi:MAG: hypothetical protein ACI3YW_00680 [Candidatus Egerieousia sp.]
MLLAGALWREEALWRKAALRREAALWQRYYCQGDPSGRCCWLGRSDRAATGRGAAAKSHREEGAMAKVPGSYVKFGKECTFAA